MVRLAELINGKPLNEAELGRLYEEWKAVGLLLGCREQDMPATKEEYWPYFDYMINQRLEYTDSVKYWLHNGFINNLKKPTRLIPGQIWNTVLKPGGWGFNLILRVSLPVAFREKFDIQVTQNEVRLYKGLAKSANAVWPLLPMRMQYVPHAFEGVKDARKNPQAFDSDLVLN